MENVVIEDTAVFEKIKDLSVYELARMAGCGNPDRADSPGGVFLDIVRQEVLDHWDELSEDLLHQIAEDAAEPGDYIMWLQFIDLEGYLFDVTDLVGDAISGRKLTEHARVVLYAIALALVKELMWVSE